MPQAFSANDTTKPSVSNFSINGTTGGKVTVAPGGSFTISYYVFNPMSTSQYGLLGASLISGGVEYNDKSHDKWQSLATYGNWYSRTFLVPSNTPGGSYDLQLGLWKDTSYSLRWNPNYDAGAVVTVTCGSSTYTYKCYNNNLYYYDQCGNRQSMKTACGSSYDEVNFCSSSSNVAKIHHDKGCSNTQCYDNLSSVQVQACNAFEVCNNGACQSKCTENATRCASDTVKEICSQGLWVQQSLAYCYFDGTKAVQVGCVQNSNCGSGLTCDTASHTCISPCSGDTGNHRCSSDLTKTEKEVYNGSCTSKTWVTDLTCSNTQYCSLSGIVPTCLTRIFNGFSCTPGGSSTRLCQSTLCNPFSVCSSSICAGETAKITADSSGNITQTNLPSGKYCLDTSSGANEVNCLRDSQCTNGGKCNTTSYTCQSPCTQGTATGNKRCGTNLATVESEYTNADCSKYWSTTKTCFTDPTVALQYCNNAPITGPDCAIRLSEGAACQPASSTTLACTSGICTSNSTCGCTLSQKKCASTTVAQICGSLGTWTSTTCNAGYACSNGDCIPNCSVGSYTGNYRCSSDSKSIEGEYYTSNCSKDWKVSSSCSLTQTCDASQKKCLDWAITSPIWSKTAANPLEQVSLSVTTANIPNGTIIKFGVIDGSSITSPATIYDTLSGTVTNNSVQVPWTVYPFTPIAGSFVALKFTACDGSDRICVTSGAMNANALVSSATWSKSTVQIGDTVTMIANFNAPDGTKIKFDLSEFDQLSANDKLGIFYGTLQGGKAETTITIPALKDLFTTPQIQFLASIDAYPSKTTRSSKLTVNNDTKLNIDYYDNYVEQDFLQAFEWSVSGAKPTETGLEYGNSKTVRCSGTQPICYKRAPGTLTEENKYLALLKNASVGTIYARAYALRSDGNTYYSDWVSSTIYAHDTSKLIVYLNKIDFADPIWNITKIFTVGNCIDNKVLSWGCAFDVILLLPAGSLKVLSKSPEVIKLLRGLDAAKEVDVALNGLKSTKKNIRGARRGR